MSLKPALGLVSVGHPGYDWTRPCLCRTLWQQLYNGLCETSWWLLYNSLYVGNLLVTTTLVLVSVLFTGDYSICSFICETCWWLQPWGFIKNLLLTTSPGFVTIKPSADPCTTLGNLLLNTPTALVSVKTLWWPLHHPPSLWNLLLTTPIRPDLCQACWWLHH